MPRNNFLEDFPARRKLLVEKISKNLYQIDSHFLRPVSTATSSDLQSSPVNGRQRRVADPLKKRTQIVTGSSSYLNAIHCHL